MRVVFPVCCGVDVHKSFLVATMITTHSHQAEPVYHKKRFSTFHRSLVEFKEWLLESQCFDVCMESTGKYWIPVFNVLEGFEGEIDATQHRGGSDGWRFHHLPWVQD